MKIATYNLWNSREDFRDRAERAAAVLRQLDADLVCLQEVRAEFSSRYQHVAHYLADQLSYTFMAFEQYPDEDEGLAVLSRYPISDSLTNCACKIVQPCRRSSPLQVWTYAF